MSARDDLIREEGVRLKPYRDTVGKLTIGVGHNLDDLGITSLQAVNLLDDDISSHEADLDRDLPWWRGVSQGTQSALVQMCFQLGIAGLLGFKNMLAALEAADYATARQEAADSPWATTETPARAARVIALMVP